MKYQSELIEEIVDTRGHKESSLHYESECIETWIKEAKGAYPKLCDYESEWLKYISILDDTGGSEDPEPPIGEFPYIVLSDVTEATIDNVVPYAYKSAILRGDTLVNVVSEQTFGGNKTVYEHRFYDNIFNQGETFTIFVVNPNVTTIKVGLFNPSTGYWEKEIQYNVSNNKKIVYTVPAGYLCKYVAVVVRTPNDATGFENSLVIVSGDKSNLEIDKYFDGMQSVQTPVLTTSNEDGTKSNILTVNENVVLRGIGDVKDELDLLTGELTERIGEIVLDGSDDEKWNLSWGESENYIGFQLSATIPNVKGYSPNQISNLLPPTDYSALGGKDYEWFVVSHSNTFNLKIAKNRLISPNVDGLKRYLAINPLIVQYQLAENTIKTVELNIQDQNGKTLNVIKPIEGKMFLSTSSNTIKPLFSGEIPVEAITQNLASFIDLD